VQPRKCRFGDLDLRFEGVAGEFLHQDPLDALTSLRVVAVARHVQQAREEPLIRVAPQQQAHAPALVEVDDAAERAHQFGDARLEQLVPGMALEDVHQCLAIVAHRRDAEMVDDSLHLVAQQRNLARARTVGGRREQADETTFARNPAACVERLHADVVEVGGAMDRRNGIGLGHDERDRFAGLASDFASQQRRLRTRPAGAGAQQAEAGLRDRHQAVRGRAAFEPVLAVAEEREMVVGEPVEERAGLLCLGSRQARHLARHGSGEIAGLLQHGRPVFDGDTYIAERGLDA